MLVLSYAIGLTAFDPERVVALRGLDSATFKRPVRIGDTIRVRSRVEQVKPLDGGRALVGFAWRILNQHDQVVVRVRVEALWRVDDAPVAVANGAGESEELYADRVLV